MGFFRKLLMTIWFLATVLGVAALALTVFGPWVDQVLALFAVQEFAYAVEGCLAVSLVGALIMWIRVLSRRKKVNAIVVGDEDGGQITVTRDAIASQARYIVEADGTCDATRVNVLSDKRGGVTVHVTIRPHSSVPVVQKGAQLREELADGLARLCGEKLGEVSLEFLAPDEPSDISQEDASVDALSYSDGHLVATDASYEPAGVPTADAVEPMVDGTGDVGAPVDAPDQDGVHAEGEPLAPQDGVTIPLRRPTAQVDEPIDGTEEMDA